MSIWQFGNTYIHDDGKPASSEEIRKFQQRHAALEVAGRERAIKEQKEHEAWVKKYDPIMRKYFAWWYEDMDEPYASDESTLIYQLSTVIFDHTKNWNEDEVRNSEIVKELRRYFPDLVEEAIVGYLDHAHDT